MTEKQFEKRIREIGTRVNVTFDKCGKKHWGLIVQGDEDLELHYDDDRVISKDRSDYCYAADINDLGDLPQVVSNIQPLIRTIEEVQVGDEVVYKNNTRKILARVDDLVAVSHISNRDNFHNWITVKQLASSGYKIVQPEPEEEPKKMTVAEIAEELGYKVEVVEG